jgi:alpha-tubulin suppressor-like RCC1 family protein
MTKFLSPRVAAILTFSLVVGGMTLAIAAHASAPWRMARLAALPSWLRPHQSSTASTTKPVPNQIVLRAVKTWNQAAGGNWSVAANWTPNGVPAAGDDVTLPDLATTYTVTLDVNASLNSITLGAPGASFSPTLTIDNHTLTLAGASVVNAGSTINLGAGGLINGAGNLEFAGDLNWTGGQMSGTGTTHFQATSLPVLNGTLTLGRTITNDAFLQVMNPSVAGGGTTTMNATSTGSGAVFTNFGTAQFSGTVTFNNIQFNNTNTGAGPVVDVLTGSLTLSNGTGTSTAPFAVSPGATLIYSGGAYTLGTGTRYLGDGTGGGTVRLLSGTWNVTADTAVGDGTANNAVTFDLTGGTISGPAGGVAIFNITAQSTLIWNGGVMAAGGVTDIGANATLSITAAATHRLGRTINNSGTIAITDGSVFKDASGSGIINNNNAFTSDSTAPVVCSLTDILLNNNGTVTVNTGTMQVTASAGATPTGTSTKAFAVAPGAFLRFGNGIYTANAGTTFSGSGPVQLTGGTLQVNGASTVGSAVDVGEFDLAGGILTGTSTLTVRNLSTMMWTSGTMTGTGSTNIAAGGELDLPNAASGTLSRAINNSGTIGFGSGVNLGGAGGTGAINNSAVINAVIVSGGATRLSNVLFNNAATFNVTSGGAFEIGATAGSTPTGTSTGGTYNIASGATVDFANGIHTLTSVQFLGAGFARVTGGTVNANGTVNVGTAAAVGNFQIAGGTLQGTGAFNINAQGVMRWTVGTMGGTGATAIVAGGNFVMPAAASGTLSRTINNAGTMTFSSGADLNGASNTGIINNSATINASSTLPTVTRIQNVTVNNNSALNVTGGKLQLNATAGGINTGASSGTFNVSTGATFEFSNGIHTLNSATFIGAGASQLNVGTLNAQGTVHVGSAATSGTFNLVAGTLQGSGVFSIEPLGTFNWTSASTMGGTGTTVVQSGGKFNIPALATRTLSRTITNSKGGLLTISGGGSVLGAATTGVITNNGTVTASGAAADTNQLSNVAFNNNSQVNVTGGTFDITASSGSTPTGTSTGAFAVSSGASLLFSNGIHTLNTGATFTGAGTSQITGGTVNANGTVSVGTAAVAGTFQLANGVLAGSGAFNIAARGTFNWSSGTMSGTGTTNVAAGGVLNILNIASHVLSRAITNAGTINAAANTNTIGGAGAAITNAAGGVINTGAGATGVTISNTAVTNNGTLNVGGAGTVGLLSLSGSGTFTQTSGTLNLDIGGTTAGSGFDAVTVGGAATLGGTLHITLIGGFTPPAGTTYPVVTAASIGASRFASITGDSAPFTTRYTSTGLTLVSAAVAPSVIVTTTADNGNNTTPTAGSLRAAIIFANANPGTTIRFNIPAGQGTNIDGDAAPDIWTIRVAAALPPITAANTVVSGPTQAAFIGGDPNALGPEIVLDSGGLNTVDGLIIQAASCTVDSLVVNGFNSGLRFTTAAAGSDVIRGCYIGTDPTGTTSGAGRSNQIGVSIDTGAHDGTIGGSTVAQRNVISGNVDDGVAISGTATVRNAVRGNYLGVTRAGTVPLPNAFFGVTIFAGANNNTIGGSTATPGTGLGNLLSGNTGGGVRITETGSNNNRVQGNLIGTNPSGTAAVTNGGIGVAILDGAQSNTVGGTSATLRNIISGNTSNGVGIGGDTGTVSGANTINNVVQGNYIGTNITGTAAVGNISSGVALAQGANHNTIGGTAAGAGNVISGNNARGVALLDSGTSSNLVQGNLIGTNAAGTAALPNALSGVRMISGASNNTIGGTVAGARNVISGNAAEGVRIEGADSDSNAIQGNFIGTNAAGTAALPNVFGVALMGTTTVATNTIGGTTAAARNIIAGNTLDGIHIEGTGPTSNRVQGNYIGLLSDGSTALPNGGNGITIISSGNNVVGGLTSTPGTAPGNLIAGNTGRGVSISGGANNVIEGNLMGTDAAGAIARANARCIVLDTGSANNTIGGTDVRARNVLSGSEYGIILTDAGTIGNLIEGNYIGLNRAGTAAVSDRIGIGIFNGANLNHIGGSITTPGAPPANIISGNIDYGVFINTANQNFVEGNFIGTNPAGTAALNPALTTSAGIFLQDNATGNTIGGATADLRNIISGHAGHGVAIIGTNCTGNFVRSNYIGTDKTGLIKVANGDTGVTLRGAANGNFIGGAAATPGVAPGNVIAGNADDNVSIFEVVGGNATRNNVVQGNLIGTNASGTAALDPTGIAAGVHILGGAKGNVIGGTLAGQRNVISGNNDGVLIEQAGTSANSVLGNFIGTNISGTAAIPNRSSGVLISGGATLNNVGSTTAGAGNLISGNPIGVSVQNSLTSNNLVQGNFIGVQNNHTSALPNTSDGVAIVDGATNIVGARRTDTGATVTAAGNLIAFNRANGVAVSGATAVANTIRGNKIHDNTRLGIDLAAAGDPANGVTPNDAGDADTGPNRLQNFPVVTSAAASPSSVTVSGTLDSAPGKSYVVDVYASPAADPSGFGEGATYVGTTVVTTASAAAGAGHATFSLSASGNFTGQFFNATATDQTTGDTSEFGPTKLAVAPAQTLTLSATATTVSEGGPAITGTVTRSVVSATPLSVTVASSNSANVRLAPAGGGVPTTPITVTIPANVASANFSIVPVNDAILNPGGSRTASLTATAGGITSNTLTITVTDNEFIGNGLFVWGYNDFGQVGDGTTTHRPLPLLINPSVATAAAGGSHTLAVLNNGTMLAWGYNGAGELGDGTTTDRHTPVAVPGLTGVRTTANSVAAGWYHSLALKADGTVWAWGYNAAGQLGNGTTTNSSRPVQVRGPNGVGFLTNIVAVAAGVYHSLALRSDGTVWAWGYNYYGQLGNATLQDSVYPVQVHDSSGSGTLTNIRAIAAGAGHSVALTTSGMVLTWGWNFYGQLGNGNTTDRMLPGPLTSLSGVATIAAGYAHTLAGKTDGTVWNWGSNFYSQLGDGTTTDRHAPVQVHGVGNSGMLGNVRTLAAGSGHNLALRSDGSVVAWGFDFYGSLGDGRQGDNTNKAFPVVVQRMSNANQIGAAYAHSLALGRGLVVR